MNLLLGVDDAGRGPVIGNMFLGGVLIDSEQEAFLKEQNVKDSKLLSHPTRVRLSKIIEKNSIAHKVVSATPEEIDHYVETNSLNTLEAMKMAEVIDFLKKKAGGKNKIEVVVDCPSINISAWTEKLVGFVKNTEGLSIKCEHKADANHISVSAASILAKVAREGNVEDIRKKIKINFGSGYPADPKVKEFLIKHGRKFENSGIIRKSWGTWKAIVEKNGQKKLF
ncbi:MAG: ribonuclease HII [Nanoarchaeota archaeon]|nr:ribonuclease HII [Nanoarchaeota archaeon]